MHRSGYVVSGLRKTYRGGVVANDGIDLEVPAGTVVGLLGPNGAGKSTLVRQLVGLLRPDAGSLTLFGHDLLADRRAAARLVGYLAQDEPALLELTVRTAIETTARLRGDSRRSARDAAAVLLDELELAAVGDRPLVGLSGGQRRLACIASALVGDRPMLVLDEPTTGLDPVTRRRVWAALRRRRDAGATIVLVTHNVLEAESVLDRVAVVDAGRVMAAGTPGDLKAAVDDRVRIELVWRDEPPAQNPVVAELAATAARDGRRWSLPIPRARAAGVLDQLTRSGLLDSLDDFTVATPSLEDVYLAMGGTARDLERV